MTRTLFYTSQFPQPLYSGDVGPHTDVRLLTDITLLTDNPGDQPEEESVDRASGSRLQNLEDLVFSQDMIDSSVKEDLRRFGKK